MQKKIPVLSKRKKILPFLFLLLLVVAIPFTVSLTRAPLVTKQYAAESTAPLSNLPWMSGINLRGEETFATWRGRPIDTIHDYNNRNGGWGEFENPFPIAMYQGRPERLVISIPSFPQGQGSHAQCAQGAYNQHWKNFGQNLVAAGRADTIVRLDWEFNGSWGFYWQPQNDLANFIKCWQQVSQSIKSTDPDVVMDWTINGHASPNMPGNNPYSAYPGDEYVDVIGMDVYDHYPPSKSEAAFDAQCKDMNGLCYMGDFARQHGKLLSVGEWGVVTCSGGGQGGGDNPLYIQKMYDTFMKYKDVLLYENYFNNADPGNVCSSLNDPVNAPQSAAKYKELFGTNSPANGIPGAGGGAIGPRSGGGAGLPTPVPTIFVPTPTPTPFPLGYIPEISPWVFLIPGIVIFLAVMFQ